MYVRYVAGIVFVLTTVFPANCQRVTGLYVDNGFDQTIIHRSVSVAEKREIERELLNILELPDRPKRIGRRALLVKRSAPKFLLNIYHNVLSSDKGEWISKIYDSEEFDLTTKDIHVIDKSDVIMTFGAHNPHSGNSLKHNRGKRIWFDVTEVPRDHSIISAELRLYYSSSLKNFESEEVYTIAIYRIARTKDGVRVKHFIDSANMTLNKERWITLNVTEALKYWVSYPKENRGLFLAVHRGNHKNHIIRPDDIGIVGVLGTPGKQPFMVGFFKSSGQRGVSPRQQQNNLRRKSEPSSPNSRSRTYMDPNIKQKIKGCNIQTLYVNFKDLQWEDWIIAPEGYDAFYCSGDCSFPLAFHVNPTNHAIVQTLVYLMKPGKVPKPCCAPTKLSPISVLYFLDDSNVVLKKYKNMVVNSCGCQ